MEKKHENDTHVRKSDYRRRRDLNYLTSNVFRSKTCNTDHFFFSQQRSLVSKSIFMKGPYEKSLCESYVVRHGSSFLNSETD